MFRHHIATFENTIKLCKINAFQRNLSTIFLKVYNIYFILNIFQKLELWFCDKIFCNIWRKCCDNISIAMKYWKYFWYVSLIFCAMWVIYIHKIHCVLNSTDLQWNKKKSLRVHACKVWWKERVVSVIVFIFTLVTFSNNFWTHYSLFRTLITGLKKAAPASARAAAELAVVSCGKLHNLNRKSTFTHLYRKVLLSMNKTNPNIGKGSYYFFLQPSLIFYFDGLITVRSLNAPMILTSSCCNPKWAENVEVIFPKSLCTAINCVK